MPENVIINRLNHTDLNMYQCGTENCEPDHDYGPAVRDHFLIHYILRGKGVFQVGEKTYHLKKGQGFLICPDIITYYKADSTDPWHYSWVGFNGLKAEQFLKQAGLNADEPVFMYDKDDYIKNCFEQMIATKQLSRGKEIRLLGILYMFLSQLIEVNGKEKYMDTGTRRKELYTKMAVEYITMNYSRKISISEIAHHIGLDRSYLGSIFGEKLKTSLQQYLLNFRMDKACELMKNADLSIGDISRSVGYEDPLLFSKMFKKVKGLAPAKYRKGNVY